MNNTAFPVANFSTAAQLNGRLVIRDDAEGTPRVQTAPDTFGGKILEFLSHVPLFKEINVVKSYVKEIANDRAQVFGAFIQALANVYSPGSVLDVLKDHGLEDLDSPPALTPELIKSMAFSLAPSTTGTPPNEKFASTDGAEAKQTGRNSVKSPEFPFDSLLTLNTSSKNLISEQNFGLSKPDGASNTLISEQRRIPPVGISNLGNTCYANSTIKFVLGIVGQQSLLLHLLDLSQKKSVQNSPTTNDAITQLIDVLISLREGNSPDLRPFLKSLQKTEVFAGFEYNVQNDAQEFLAKLDSLFELDGLVSSAIQVRETLVNGPLTRSKDFAHAFSQDVSVTSSDLSLQNIVDLGQVRDTVGVRWLDRDEKNTEVEKKRQYVADLSTLTRFNLHINALQYNSDEDAMSKIHLKTNFTQQVKLPIVDSKTGEEWTVTLEPKDLVIHAGTQHGGHYYMYSKQDDGTWVEHNDSRVVSRHDVPLENQAKLISFEVVNRVLAAPAG